MPAYAIGRLRFENWKWLEEYGPITKGLIEKHGGRYLVRGGEAKRLEGTEEMPDAFVMLEFPSMEQARAWFSDPEYAAMIELRRAHGETDLVLLEGLPD